MNLNKEELLTAMRGVLKQYEDRTHINSMNTCPLCKLYHDSENTSCTICPMTVFDNYIGCTERKCSPVASDDYEYDTIAYARVMEFYKIAIKAFENMTEEEINKHFDNVLMAIDNMVYGKYS